MKAQSLANAHILTSVVCVIHYVLLYATQYKFIRDAHRLAFKISDQLLQKSMTNFCKNQ